MAKTKEKIRLGRKVSIENPESAGLERVVVGSQKGVLVMPVYKDNGQLDEEHSSAYQKIWEGFDDNHLYREVLGSKRMQIIEAYKRQIKE